MTLDSMDVIFSSWTNSISSFPISARSACATWSPERCAPPSALSWIEMAQVKGSIWPKSGNPATQARWPPKARRFISSVAEALSMVLMTMSHPSTVSDFHDAGGDVLASVIDGMKNSEIFYSRKIGGRTSCYDF